MNIFVCTTLQKSEFPKSGIVALKNWHVMTCEKCGKITLRGVCAFDLVSILCQATAPHLSVLTFLEVKLVWPSRPTSHNFAVGRRWESGLSFHRPYIINNYSQVASITIH